MARLQSFTLRIRSGARGLAEAPRYLINGFDLDFDQMSGGTGPGETAEVMGNPDSYPHALHLCGPKEGPWDIEEITATYYPYGEDPYTVRFGAITVDDHSDLNIWHERPARVFEV